MCDAGRVVLRRFRGGGVVTPHVGGDASPFLDQSEKVRLLARSVAADGVARLLVIGPDGGKEVAGWSSIETAARDGVAFMVTPSQNTLAIDADSAEQIAALDGIVADLEAEGFAPVRVCSGRGEHLYVRMPPTWVRSWAVRARTRGLDVRHRQPIRPPLSPHPLGLPVSLIGITFADALKALNEIPNGRRKLSRRMDRLLRFGEGIDRYASRSEAVQAVATGCVNAGYSRQWFLHALQNPN